MSAKKITAMIVDDEHLAREMIRVYLRDHPEIEVVAECENAFAALEAIEAHHPQLVFLDIQMPSMSGFEMLHHLNDPPVIIFSTAYDQYALKAFDISAADYLLKPYDRERFQKAIGRALVFLNDPTANVAKVEQLKQHHLRQSGYLQRLPVKTGARTQLIPVSQIAYLEAQADYLQIHTLNARHLIHSTLKRLEEQLDPQDFVRVHRSFMVNIKAVKAVERFGKDSLQLEMATGGLLPVSRVGWRRLKAVIGDL